VDDYYWLRERGSRPVLDYLEAENAYTRQVMRPTEALQEQLFGEMKARIKESDRSVPVQIDDYFYYQRTEAGQQYPIYCRKKGSIDAIEEILLDVNALAKGKGFLRLAAMTVSPDHRLLAYTVDTTGGERYTLRVKDLQGGTLLPDTIADTFGQVEWGNDSQTLYYTTVDASMRPYQLFRHRLGSADADEMLLREGDERFYMEELSKSRSRKYLFVTLVSKTTTEVWYVDADQPDARPQRFRPRQPGVEYRLAHHSDSFYVLTNENAVNFKLMKAAIADPAPEHWQEVIPHRDDVMIEEVAAFRGYLAVFRRVNGLPGILIRDLATGAEHEVSFDEPTYTVFEEGNPNFDSSVLRFEYTSLVTPRSVYDYDMAKRTRVLRKVREVLGGYRPADYQSERIFATAADGTRIPISLAYRKGLAQDGAKPCLLDGYGAYGISSDPMFSSNRLSLLDRGFVYAIAHVRGGGEMGRTWYLDGKMLSKKNTFTDFIAAAEKLIAAGYTSSEKLAIIGGSAGGLLIGAVLNMRPDLMKTAVAEVPFVDVVNTMLDASIPLTVTEYEEWGNPNEKQFFDYMLSYSPYDNVARQAYPNILIIAGLNDSRVQYWEPAKWAAKLRAMKTDHNRLLLETEMGAGHGGVSGRYDKLRESAFVYAFLLDTLGLTAK